MNEISSKIMKGSMWIAVTRALMILISIVSTFLLARFLVPEDFGIVALASTVLVVLTSVTELSLSSAIVRTQDPTSDHLATAWTLNVARALILSAITAAISYPLSIWFNDGRLVAILLALSFNLFLGGFINPKIALATQKLEFWQQFIINSGQKLAGLIASVAFAIVYGNYWAMVVGALATQIVNVALGYILMPYRPYLTLKKSHELLSFSGWLSLSAVVNTVNWHADTLLVGKVLGAGPLGSYSMGNNLAQMPTRELTSPLTQTLFPAFSSMVGEPKRLKLAYQRSQRLVTAVALPAGVGTSLIISPLIHLALGDKWIPSIFVVQFLAVVFALQTVGSLSYPLMMALGRTKELFQNDAKLMFVRLPIIFVGTAMFGLVGLIVARTLTGLISIFFSLQLVRRHMAFSYVEQLGGSVSTFVMCLAMMMFGQILISQNPLDQDSSSGLFLSIVAIVALCAAFYAAAYFLINVILFKNAVTPERDIYNLIIGLLRKVLVRSRLG